MIGFSTVKSLTIPEGNVTKIESNGLVLWRVVEDEVVPTTFNVPITWLFYVKLSKTTGEVESVNADDYNASEFITLVDGASYVLSTTTDVYNACNVVYYNDDNVFVGYQANLWSTNTTTDNPAKGNAHSAALQIPSGATKIRIRQYEAWKTQGDSTKYITLTGMIG